MDIKFYAIAALLLSSVLAGALSVYSILNFRTLGAKSYACLMACVAIYSCGYAFELHNVVLSRILIASKIQYFGISFIPVLWLLVAAKYAGCWGKIAKRLYPLLFVIPLLTLILRLTNDYHHLVYASTVLNESGPFPVLSITRGTWYYVNTIFAYGCLLAGNLFFLHMAIKTVGPYRKQAIVLVVLSLFPWIADILYQKGLSPVGLDLAPFAFALVGGPLAWGVFHFHIFDFVPIARDTVFDFMRDSVVVFDNADRLVDYNRSAASIFEVLDQRSIGAGAEELFGEYPELLEGLRSEFSENRDIRIRCDEDVHVFELSIVPMVPNNRRPVGLVVVLHEVTEQRELMAQLHDLANLDGLTGIYNHRHLMDLSQRELDRARRHGRPVTLLLADLDFFKQINDAYGHQAGDAVLREVAAVFQKNLRSSDILGRYGGEEFGVLLPETLPDAGKELANRIRDDLASLKIPYGEQDISITASFGVAGGRFDSDNPDNMVSLFKRTDEMLYKAKGKGRNLVVLAEEDDY